MTQITGGKVVYGRTVQPAQYESKKSEVELTFSVEDGQYDEKALDAIIQTAITKAHEMVGVAAAPKTTRKAKVETPELTIAATSKEAFAAKANGKGQDAVLDALNDLAQTTKPEPKKAVDDLGDILGDVATPAKVYSDMDLVDVVNRTNARISNPKAIKALCATFTTQGIKDIPAEKRAEFVTALEGLTPAAA
jgi:hypothetical protein